MSDLEIVKIKDGDSYKIINKSDFKDGSDELFHEKGEGEATDRSPGMEAGGKNPSGTFSEPTPTDIRYPNVDATEFENNHGAFVAKSAADLRQERGLPDAPGGIMPEVVADVDPDLASRTLGAEEAEPEPAHRGKSAKK